MERRPPDALFSEPRLAELYDITSPWSEDRTFYLQLAEGECASVLDLGCGTGLVTAAYAAAGHRAVGVDPAAAMLQVARVRPHGDRVTWVCAHAQDYRSDLRFDLAIMTGHALQALVTDEELAALFAMVASHLRADGRFVFETRNPALDWAARWHGRRGRFRGPSGAFTMNTEVHESTEEIIAFEHRYLLGSETLSSFSRLRFPTLPQLKHLLTSAGLDVADVYGDWQFGALTETSEEIVVVARLRP